MFLLVVFLLKIIEVRGEVYLGRFVSVRLGLGMRRLVERGLEVT